MLLSDIKNKIPEELFTILKKDIKELRPAQEKAVEAGLFDEKNLIICTPTASGKTLIAEMVMLKRILEKKGKAVYIVPLRALGSEKQKDFKKRYGNICKIAFSSGDMDSSDSYLENYDLIITTSEKLDSLTRHNTPWINEIATVIVDEIHLLNDPSRGPTLEILITMLKQSLENVQFVGLSATIGNPKELAEWLDAKAVIDDWRPVKLKQGVYFDGEIKFKD
ncbi:MAG: ATP-dependent DNA helicase [Candidatus Woesearchaeota archaeon]|nr:ATP-dependent DNA helicase [Candidatus Woesearchaeota archaeon]